MPETFLNGKRGRGGEGPELIIYYPILLELPSLLYSSSIIRCIPTGRGMRLLDFLGFRHFFLGGGDVESSSGTSQKSAATRYNINLVVYTWYYVQYVYTTHIIPGIL